MLLDFYASGFNAFDCIAGFDGLGEPVGCTAVGSLTQLDTDLSLLPILQDLRQNNIGPVHTKASFDIWNQNEDFFSGTDRCIVCWDQFLLSNLDLPNHFLFDVFTLQTRTGKARIHGIASPTVCDETLCGEDGEPPCSEDAPLLGVSNKLITFSSVVPSLDYAAGILRGQGLERGYVYADVPAPPVPLLDGRGQQEKSPELSRPDVKSESARSRHLDQGRSR